jgi:hypothetical protein
MYLRKYQTCSGDSCSLNACENPSKSRSVSISGDISFFWPADGDFWVASEEIPDYAPFCVHLSLLCDYHKLALSFSFGLTRLRISVDNDDPR